jgi:hypothetical protein
MFIWMDDDSIFVCVFTDVGSRGQEVELVGESSRHGLVRPPRVEPRVGEDVGGTRLVRGQ